MHAYTTRVQKHNTLLLLMTSNISRFSKFFHKCAHHRFGKSKNMQTSDWTN